VIPGEPDGTWVLKDDPSQRVYVPVTETSLDTAYIKPQAPTGEVTVVDGRQVTRLYGTVLGSNYVQDPVLGMVRFLPDEVGWARAILGPWVGILAATILFIATNAGLIGVSRLAYSLGQHRQLPPVLGRVHPTRLTPYVAITAFGIIAIVLITPGSTLWRTSTPRVDDLIHGGMYDAGVATEPTSAALPRSAERPRERRRYRYCRRGRWAPSVWIVIVWFQSQSRLIGFAWMGAGLLAYVIYRKAKGFSLTRTVLPESLPAFAQEDIVYDQLLVPVVGTQVTDEMMVLACQLATERNSAIDAVRLRCLNSLDAQLPAGAATPRRCCTGRGRSPASSAKLTPIIITALGRPGDRRQATARRSESSSVRISVHRRQGLGAPSPRAPAPALRGHHQRRSPAQREHSVRAGRSARACRRSAGYQARGTAGVTGTRRVLIGSLSQPAGGAVSAPVATRALGHAPAGHTPRNDEGRGMPFITALLTEHALLRLASPRAVLDGASTAEHGSVEFEETDEQHLRARVEDTQIYETELSCWQ
jgi:hypothetical protein